MWEPDVVGVGAIDVVGVLAEVVDGVLIVLVGARTKLGEGLTWSYVLKKLRWLSSQSN